MKGRVEPLRADVGTYCFVIIVGSRIASGGRGNPTDELAVDRMVESGPFRVGRPAVRFGSTFTIVGRSR